MTLLEQILNTPSLKTRGFAVRRNEFGLYILRDGTGYCPLCALAEEQGMTVVDKSYPWPLFPYQAYEVNAIVDAADRFSPEPPDTYDIRVKLMNFLCTP